MGLHFTQNFNYPYMSKSIKEFWRRWHMTLSGWFRNYVYIPLGGNRVGKWKLLRNLLVVWFLTGLWHGASWNFILWGLYFGLLLILENFVIGKFLEKLPSFLRVAYAFLLVVFRWVLFEFDDLAMVGGYFKAMFGGNGMGFVDSQAIYFLLSYAVIFVICIIASTNYPKRLVTRLMTKIPNIIRYASPVVELCFMVLCTAYLVDATYNPFLYFRF